MYCRDSRVPKSRVINIEITDINKTQWTYSESMISFMHSWQINIHKSSRTARSYNSMLHVVTRLYLHRFSLLFRPCFSCSDEQDVIVFSKSKPLFIRDSQTAWQDSVCYVCLCIQKILFCVYTCAGRSSCLCWGSCPTTNNQSMSPWGVMQPTFPVSFREIRTHCSQNRGTQTQQAQLSHSVTPTNGQCF